MTGLRAYEFWFVVGSQYLYGEEVLRTVSQRAEQMARSLNESEIIPCPLVYKATVKTHEEITALVKEANYHERCAGLIVWMHTFSPSKMWINALAQLAKPYCHLHTQFNRRIPNEEIDMDFMNLNQAAHGDREHGFIAARLRIPRKIVVGFWEDAHVHKKIAGWMRSAVGAAESRSLRVIRFGDNMREVAVTEGDKIEAQASLGWQVNTWPVGHLVEIMDQVRDEEIRALYAECAKLYDMKAEDEQAITYQLREEIAMRRILEREGAWAYTNNFQDLYGMRQLPGLASQRLMAAGYGYGGEGDWKAAAMTRIIKRMSEGLPGGTSFMEDYTCDLEPGQELTLGSHMLEVCPTTAAGRPRIEVHPLSIGGREPPARLVFEGHEGSAVLASLVDMGGRFRLIVQDITAVKPIYDMPNLPVARLMWRAAPDHLTGAHAWILAGGSHHTVLSYAATADMLEDWAEIMGIEYIHISADTTIEGLKKELFMMDLAWKLR